MTRAFFRRRARRPFFFFFFFAGVCLRLKTGYVLVVGAQVGCGGVEGMPAVCRPNVARA